MFNDTDEMDEIIDDLLDKLLFYYRCRLYKYGCSVDTTLDVVSAIEDLRRKISVSQMRERSGSHPQRCDRMSQLRKLT